MKQKAKPEREKSQSHFLFMGSIHQRGEPSCPPPALAISRSLESPHQYSPLDCRQRVGGRSHRNDIQGVGTNEVSWLGTAGFSPWDTQLAQLPKRRCDKGGSSVLFFLHVRLSGFPFLGLQKPHPYSGQDNTLFSSESATATRNPLPSVPLEKSGVILS